MAVIKCKMCGGDMELSADKTFGTCEYCGSTMTLPKVDDDQRAAAFNRGNHFRRIGEFDKALAVYERIVREDENDAEAHWCCALCRFGIEYVEDPNTYEYLPTCHRASFDNFLEDVDYLAAVEHSDGITRRQYQKDAAKIAEVQKGILATSQNEEPFDVFICYKETDADGNRTRDSIMAQEIYYQFTEQGRRVFFARITLEDKVGTQYEPYIFAALNSAKVMVALGTSEANFNAVWVKNEWSRFLSLMKKDRRKLLLPCYRDMDPYDLPEALSILQSYDMGKIGFMQDLTRGISKVLDAEKPEPVKETVVIQNESGVNGAALLKRGWMALEDGEWAKADKFFEDVLNQDAECGEAYCGKYFASERCNDMQTFIAMRLHRTETSQEEQKLGCERNKQIEAEIIQQYTVPGYLDDSTIRKMLDFSRLITSTVSGRTVQLEKEQQFFTYEKLLVRASKYATGDFRKSFSEMKESIFHQMQERIDCAIQKEHNDSDRIKATYEKHLEEVQDRIATEFQKATELREHDYMNACREQESVKTSDEAAVLARKFEALKDYSDSKKLAFEWQKKAGKLQQMEQAAIERAKNEEELARRREAEEKKRQEEIAEQERLNKIKRQKAEDAARQKARAAVEAKKKKERMILIGIAVVVMMVVVAAAWHMTLVVIPRQRYEEAESLFQADRYDEALDMFVALGKFENAEERCQEIRNILAEDALNKAEALFQAGHYEEALDAFTKLNGFQNAEERCQEVRYAWAEELLNQQDYHSAIDIFSVLSDYKDSREKLLAAWGKLAQRETLSTNVYHTVGLKEDGTVVATQYRGASRYYYGQCDVSNWTDIVSISAGYSYTVGLKANGTVVAAGENNAGQCNITNWTDIVSISAGEYHTVGLKADGTVVAVGSNTYGQCDVSDWTDIVSVFSGDWHTVGLKADGTVVATGENDYGQCNVTGWKNIVSISAGGNHTVGLKADGTVVAAGWNGHSQCDITNWKNIVSISAGDKHTVGLKADGTVMATGNNKRSQCDITDWTDIVSISAGEYHTVGLKADGTVVAVGYNDRGQCDVSDWANIKLPNNE